jgi:uncharacterized protein
VGETDLRTGPADGPYWRALAAGRLVMQRCQGCEHWHWPAVWRCGECGTWEPEWHEIGRDGIVYSWTKTWHRFPGSEGIPLPYTTVLVALPQAGGRRLLGLYEGDESALALDLPVQAVIGEMTVGVSTIPCVRWRSR